MGNHSTGWPLLYEDTPKGCFVYTVSNVTLHSNKCAISKSGNMLVDGLGRTSRENFPLAEMGSKLDTCKHREKLRIFLLDTGL